MWEDGELDLLVLSGRMLANSANNNIPFLLKLPWDSAFASGESMYRKAGGQVTINSRNKVQGMLSQLLCFLSVPGAVAGFISLWV